MSYIKNVKINEPLTRFSEVLTAKRNSQFSYKPTWGISSLRYLKTETGTGAVNILHAHVEWLEEW